MTKRLRAMSLCGMAALLAAGLAAVSGPAVAAGDDIAGVVTSASGPEAGVWVIAETLDFDTKYRKIVVTDDAGRFLYRICQRRAISCGSVVTAWSTRRGHEPSPATTST